jgi:hypothetical protein
MNQDRNTLLSVAFHEVETLVGGHVMRPMSLASYDVMLRIENPLVSGNVPAEDTPEFTGAMIGFVYVHCAPWPDVVRASFDSQEFRVAALIFCGDLTPADFKVAFKRLEDQSLQLQAAQAEALSSGRIKKPRPATSRGS